MIDQVETPPEAVIELPGRRLREAREARGYTIADVAQALKFASRQIEALEADDYTALPGPTFVRGFVRSYAKYLKLDQGDLVAMLESRAPLTTPDVRPPENMGTAMEAPGTRQISPLVAASVFLLVLAVVLGGWHFLGGSNGASTVAVISREAPVANTPSPADAVMPPQVRVEQPAAETPPAPAVPLVATAPTPLPVPAAVPVAGNSAPPPMPGGKPLAFVFREKSWLEVKDASQRIIFTGEQPAGSRQVVNGKPPFQLVIGNAAKVELQYDDRQIDLKPHTRAEVARLTLE